MLFSIVLLISFVSVSGHSLKSPSLEPAWHDASPEDGGGRLKRFAVQSAQSKTSKTSEQICTLPDGKRGICRPLRHCVRDDIGKDFWKFMDYLCVLNNMVGACCPEDAKRGGLQGLAGVLPAIAPQERDAVEKVIKAENRGCGLTTRRQTDVQGQRLPKPREWPWMVYLVETEADEDGVYCGGALITERHVLTAAHCLYMKEPQDITVRLGEYDEEQDNDTRSYDFKVEEVRMHEEYYHFNHKSDVAILKLIRFCLFNTYVWPICLPQPGLDLTNKIATLVGWGTTSYGGPKSNVLQEVTVPVWERTKCVNSFADTVFEENICAGSPDGYKDACQYDSGGPLMYQSAGGRWMVVGVVSWGIKCGEPNHPGIYTLVDRFIPWIERNTGL